MVEDANNCLMEEAEKERQIMLQEIKDEAYQQKVLRVRQMLGEEKMAEGYRLFEQECAALRAEIRKQHPALKQPEVDELLRWRLRMNELRGSLPAELSYRAYRA
jgi:hypothetical protein